MTATQTEFDWIVPSTTMQVHCDWMTVEASESNLEAKNLNWPMTLICFKIITLYLGNEINMVMVWPTLLYIF